MLTRQIQFKLLLIDVHFLEHATSKLRMVKVLNKSKWLTRQIQFKLLVIDIIESLEGAFSRK